MAIEPLGSAMSYTMQQAVKPVEVSANAAEAREGQPVEANAAQVDAKTIALAKSQESDAEGKDAQGGQEQDKKKQQQPPVNNDTIKKAMDELAKKQANYATQFGIHEKTNRFRQITQRVQIISAFKICGNNKIQVYKDHFWRNNSSIARHFWDRMILHHTIPLHIHKKDVQLIYCVFIFFTIIFKHFRKSLYHV